MLANSDQMISDVNMPRIALIREVTGDFPVAGARAVGAPAA